MRSRYLSATVVVGLVMAQAAAAVTYEGIDFPQGDASFADEVITFNPAFGGGNVPTDPNYVNPVRATGPPDYQNDSGGTGGEFNGTGAVALGSGGRLELLFGDNVVTNGAGADLAIFERGVAESFTIAVRPANQTTRIRLFNAQQCLLSGYCQLVGPRMPTNHTVLIDLDAEFGGSFAPGDLRFDAIQLTDTLGQGATSGEQVGADIDAVGAIASGAIMCGDGLIEGDETCDDDGVQGGDGCSATCQIEPCWKCVDGVEPSSCSIDAGGPCDDGEPCTTNDTCGGPMGLTCIGGPPPVCDDANPCTDDSCVTSLGCDYVPNTATCDDGISCSVGDHCDAGACIGAADERSGCHLSLGTTQLRILNRFDDDSDNVIWKWPNGEATTFTHPAQGSGSYELCVFDGPPSARRLRLAARADKAQACGAASCWRAKGQTGFLFRNSAAPFGMRQLLLKSGANGKAKVLAKGRGAALNLSDDLMVPPVRAEIRDTSSSECWEDAYGGADIVRNGENGFKATH